MKWNAGPIVSKQTSFPLDLTAFRSGEIIVKILTLGSLLVSVRYAKTTDYLHNVMPLTTESAFPRKAIRFPVFQEFVVQHSFDSENCEAPPASFQNHHQQHPNPLHIKRKPLSVTYRALAVDGRIPRKMSLFFVHPFPFCLLLEPGVHQSFSGPEVVAKSSIAVAGWHYLFLPLHCPLQELHFSLPHPIGSGHEY